MCLLCGLSLEDRCEVSERGGGGGGGIYAIVSGNNKQPASSSSLLNQPTERKKEGMFSGIYYCVVCEWGCGNNVLQQQGDTTTTYYTINNKKPPAVSSPHHHHHSPTHHTNIRHGLCLFVKRWEINNRMGLRDVVGIKGFRNVWGWDRDLLLVTSIMSFQCIWITPHPHTNSLCQSALVINW